MKKLLSAPLIFFKSTLEELSALRVDWKRIELKTWWIYSIKVQFKKLGNTRSKINFEARLLRYEGALVSHKISFCRKLVLQVIFIMQIYQLKQKLAETLSTLFDFHPPRFTRKAVRSTFRVYVFPSSFSLSSMCSYIMFFIPLLFSSFDINISR